MAAAEARAVWQRTANRCFVQEDAKRAPKLACCQSSSSSKQTDSTPTGVADAHNHPAVGLMPLNWNPSYSNLSPDMRWWLQLQPSYGPQKVLTNEQLNALEDEVESTKSEINSLSKVSRVHQQDAQDASGINRKRNNKYSLDSTETMKNSEYSDMESVECHVSKKTNDFCYDPESPWVGGGKAEPWWRTTDKDELASLVAQKSLDFIDNCDLPPPQKMHVRRYSDACSGSFDNDEVSSLGCKSQTGPSPIVNAQASPDSVRTHGRQMSSVGQVKMQCASDASFSTTQKDIIEQVTESDPTKAQLLEALCHSQTRAREAEKAAKQASAEKEDIIKLFFKQAAQLFAYKQWFQMLQLEALYVQIKNNEQPVSTLFPVVLPWTPYNSRELQKSRQKTGKGRRRNHGKGQPRPDMTKYAVAFALGLSLVGAGLLLGWTVGCMLPF
ncbi:hypothetical protein REPUB_Repub17cG0143000 [Reevesia pubescens]